MIEILRYKKASKPGILLGYFDLRVQKWGNLIIYRCSHFHKNSHEWISFPAHANEINGEKKYFSYMRFESPEIMKRFTSQCLEAIKLFVRDNPLQTDNGEPF